MIRRKSLTPDQVAHVRAIYSARCCADCAFLQSYVNWWCREPNAIRERGTAIPGIIHCPYWAPDKRYIRKKIKK